MEIEHDAKIQQIIQGQISKQGKLISLKRQ